MANTTEQWKWALEVDKCANDFEYLCNTYLHIKSKTVIGFPTLKLNKPQLYLWARIQDQWKREGYVRQIWGKCLDPGTLVLTADLRWQPLGDLHVGERVISVDEFPPITAAGQSRRFRTATILAFDEVKEPAFQLVLDNGATIIATGQHRFLSRAGFGAGLNTGSTWKEVRQLNQTYNGRAGKHRLRLIVNPWGTGLDYEDGWMGGILDGEGCFRWKRTGAEINITQAAGPVWDRITAYLKRHNYTFHVTLDDRDPGTSSKLGSKPLYKATITRMNEIWRLLGQTHPSRFAVHDWWDGKALGGCGYGDNTSWPVVQEIIPLGKRPMVDIQTSTGTFLANGVVSHNSRQIGASTLVHALNFWRTNFHDYHNSFIIDHDEPSSYEQFDKIKTFYDALPDPLKSVTKYWAKGKIDFEDRRSRILCGHARNANVGAGDMNHFLHMTEAARYPNADHIQTSIFPSISEAKGADPSFIIIESTSFFGGDWFKNFAEDAMAGRNGFEFHFIPYYMHDDYKRLVPPDFRMTEEEKQLLRSYPLMTPENVYWRRHKRSEYANNPVLFEQEYPISWEQSWILPSGTSMTFDQDRLDQLSSAIRPGVRAFVSEKGLDYSIGGHLEVWEPPIDGCYYDIGIDIAEGRTATADWTVLEVIRRDTLEQVAEARGHWDPAGEEFLNLCYWTGMLYNRGQMIPDITGGWGHALLSDLQRRDYPNLWQWRRRDDAKERVSNRVGFLYTQRDKALLVNNAVRVITREEPKIHSHQLIEEMRAFLTIGLDEWGASPGHYDDMVNAWALALMGSIDEGRRGAPAMKLPPKEYKERCYYHNIDDDLNPNTAQSGDFVARHSK